MPTNRENTKILTNRNKDKIMANLVVGISIMINTYRSPRNFSGLELKMKQLQ